MTRRVMAGRQGAREHLAEVVALFAHGIEQRLRLVVQLLGACGKRTVPVATGINEGIGWWITRIMDGLVVAVARADPA